MSDSDKPLLMGTVQLSPEQMQLILKNQQQFLTIFQQQLAAVIKEQAKTKVALVLTWMGARCADGQAAVPR